jgi:hypothetical protein
MLELGTTDFYISAPLLDRGSFEHYSVTLFDEWEKQVGETLSISDYALQLVVEEGSVSGKAKIAATIGAIYLGVGQYGSFVQGLEIIGTQLRSVGTFLSCNAAKKLGPTTPPPTTRNRGGAVSQLHRLFVKVNNREITPEQAVQEAEVLLGDEAAQSPEFLEKLRNELHQLPLQPKQLILEGEEFDEAENDPNTENKKPRGPSRPRPVASLSNQLRVVVWRDSKKGKKKITVTEI